MKSLLIIINPCAGKKQANKYLVDIVDEFCRAGYQVSVKTTEKAGDGTHIAIENASKYDLLVCIGGDGTFNEVASGVIESGVDVPIGYIPAGSTNDFASSLHLSKDVVQAAKDIATGHVRAIDMGSFNGRHFSYVASFGAFTRTSYETPQSIKNALGHLAYILEGVKDIPSIKAEKLWIKMENGVYGGEYIFGAICNSTSVAGLLTLSDDIVDLNDGLFEVLLIKAPANILELNQILFDLANQKYNSSMISLFSSHSLEITARPEMSWTLDGEYQKGAEIINVENKQSAVKIMVSGA